jgi:hypothetical protein
MNSSLMKAMAESRQLILVTTGVWDAIDGEMRLPAHLGDAGKGNLRLRRDEFVVNGRCVALARRERAARPGSIAASRIRAFANSLGAARLTLLTIPVRFRMLADHIRAVSAAQYSFG